MKELRLLPHRQKVRIHLTISNYTKAEGGTQWTAKDQTFNEAPKKVVANTTSSGIAAASRPQGSDCGVSATFGAADEVAADYAELNDLGATISVRNGAQCGSRFDFWPRGLW